MAKKKRAQPEGAPAWVVTYGDMMSLLLTFFVLLVSMSELRQETRFQKVMESIRQAFGYDGGLGRVPSDQIPEVSLIRKLMHIQIPEEIKHIGDSPDEGVEGRRPLVTEVRKRWKLSFGGALMFERDTAQLLEGRRRVLESFAEKIRGLTNLVEIVGHTSLDEVATTDTFESKDALALARARQVRDILIDLGIEAERMRLVSAADHEPLLSQAYDEARRARNRRVEITVTEALVNEYQGENLSPEPWTGQSTEW